MSQRSTTMHHTPQMLQFAAKTFSVLFIFISFLGMSDGVCPNAECLCHRGEIICANYGYRAVPRFEVVNETYDVLDLEGNKLKKIRAAAFENLKVNKIKIRHNSATLEINRKAFRGVEDVLETFLLSRSDVPTLPVGFLR